MRRTHLTDVFVDLCSQRDYLTADGAHPCGNADQVRANLKRLMAVARWAKVPILSCVDARRPEEVRGLRCADCVIGTPGQRKLPFSILPSHILVDSDNCLCVSLDILTAHQQAILAKNHRDPFTNPKFDRLLTELPTRQFVLFGVALENAVRLVALGLLLRHRHVTVVHDACGWWNQEEAHMALRQLEAKGCHVVSTTEVLEGVLARNKVGRRLLRRSVA